MMRRDVNLHSHPSRVEHVRHVVEIVAFGIAAIWALYVFVYQERIKPATAPLTLLHEINVEHEAIEGGKELVRVDASFKNIGESVVQIDGMVVNMYGFRFGSKSGESTDEPMDGVAKTNFGLMSSKPVPLYSFFDEWPSMGSHKVHNLTIEPGQVWHEYFAFAVPKGSYDAANADFYFCASHPTSRVWPAPKVRQADGTWFWRLPAEQDGLSCGYQRSGLTYAL